MPTNPVIEFLERMRGTQLLREGQERTDGQLLECFVRCRDRTALETLVRRHGPMVWGVCRRTLANHEDAKDAFQATFLVFFNKAASLRSQELLANWLHGVARQTARKARQMAAKRSQREKQVAVMPEPEAESQEREFEPGLRLLLDEELNRLPEKYRIAIVLCDLEGRSRRQVAQQLRLPEGTVGSRLARGRAILAKRLVRRGLTASATTLAVLISQEAAAAGVPTAVLRTTISVATLVSAGEDAAAGAISAQVSTLTREVLKAILPAQLKTVIFVLLVAGFIPSGGLLAHHILAGHNDASGSGDAASHSGSVAVSAPAEKVGLVRTFKAPTASGAIKGVAFSPNGSRLVACANDGFVRQYDVASGKELWAFDCHAPGLDSVRDVAGSPDGRMALVAVQDCTVRLLDMATGRELRQFKGHKARILGVSFSPDNRFALSGSGTWDSRQPQDNSVIMWDVATGNEIRRFVGHTFWVGTPVFSPDMCCVLSPSGDKTVRLWNAQTGDEIQKFLGHTGFIRTAVFSRDGRFVLSGSEDSTIRLWDVGSGLEVQRFIGHKGIVEAVVLSSDARRALSAGKDGTLRLWDVANGKEILCLKGHAGPVNTLVLSRNGNYALTGGADETVRLWRLPDPDGQ
jgi:RNA polymerase sigma factor (sigma-70 family)